MPTQQITLDLGESGEISFSYTPTEAKIYSVSVNGLHGSFEAKPPPIFNPWNYDTNGSCYIEIDEQLVAVEDYNGGQITLDQLNEVIYLFENHIRNPVCPAPAFDPWNYDTNGSGYIEIDEQLVAVEDYNGGLITLDQLYQVIYLYENHIYRWG